MMLNAYLDEFLQHLKYERNLSPHTLRNYASDLDQWARWVAWMDTYVKAAPASKAIVP